MASVPATVQQVRISPLSDAIRLVGRHDVVRYDEDVVRFDAAGFEVQFRVFGATEVKAVIAQEISGPSGWYMVDNPTPEMDSFTDGCMHSAKMGLSEGKADLRMRLGEAPGSQPHHFLVYVDGVPQLKPPMKSRCYVCTFDTTEAIDGQAREYTIARGLDRSKSYHIRVVKTSEPSFSDSPVPNWLALHSVILDQGFAQKPDPPRARKIEFLGDSMMTGYCNTCKGSLCHGGQGNGSNMGGEPPDTFRWGSFALAWPHFLCEDLQAECHATVMSGTGMHGGLHPDGSLPHYWQRTLASDNGTTWDFHSWTPDVLMMQVASHDRTAEADVWASYEDFFDTVFEKYPGAPIVLVCGPYHPWNDQKQSDGICAQIQGLLNEKKDRAAQIHMLVLSKSSGMPDFNECCGHPDEDFGKFIAAKAAEKVEEAMVANGSW